MAEFAKFELSNDDVHINPDQVTYVHNIVTDWGNGDKSKVEQVVVHFSGPDDSSLLLPAVYSIEQVVRMLEGR